MSFEQVRSQPYPWPFDAAWSAADTALLVVDPWLPLAKLAVVLEACRALGILIVLLRGMPLSFEPLPGEPVVDRLGDSGFFATDLDHLLRGNGVRNLILAGAPTEGAVHATMREANDRGYECLLLEDACASTEPRFHEAILRITRSGHGLFGCTAPVAALLEAMGC